MSNFQVAMNFWREKDIPLPKKEVPATPIQKVVVQSLPKPVPITPAMRIVDRCIAEYSSDTPLNERLGPKLFASYKYLDKKDQQEIKNEAENRLHRVIQVHSPGNELEKRANREYAAATKVLEGIASEGAAGKRRRGSGESALKEMAAHPLVVKGSKPSTLRNSKEFANALIAEDVKLMSQAVTLSDVAPVTETTIGRLLLRNYNSLAEFVEDAVLLAPDKKRAAKRIRFFIRVMKRLEKLEGSEGKKGDHLSLVAIGDALNSHNITRVDWSNYLTEKEFDYIFGNDGAYKALRKEYLDVGKAFKMVPKAAIFNPGFFSTSLDRTKELDLEERIEMISKLALTFKGNVRSIKEIPTVKKDFHLSVPSLPPEGYVFPEEHIKANDDRSEYLYLMSRALD